MFEVRVRKKIDEERSRFDESRVKGVRFLSEDVTHAFSSFRSSSFLKMIISMIDIDTYNSFSKNYSMTYFFDVSFAVLLHRICKSYFRIY